MIPRVTRYDLRATVAFDPPHLDAVAAMTLADGDGPTPFLLNRSLAAAGAALVPMEDLPDQQVAQVVVEEPGPEVELRYQGEIGPYEDTGMLYLKDRIDPAFTILRLDAFAYPVPGRPSHAWLKTRGWPRFDYRAEITVPEGHVVANGGRLVRREGGTFVFENLLPAWRMDFAIAEYGVRREEGSRVYHFPEDADGAGRVMAALQGVMRLYVEWFGPLRERVPFTVIEIPDGWGSQADVTSILQTAAAFRNPDRMVELYHEVSHLWNVTDLDQPSPRWNEGLACFLQYLAAERLEDRPRLEEAVTKVREKLLATAETLPALSEVPMIDYGQRDLTDCSYSVALLMFRELYDRMGEKAFGRALGGYYRENPDGATTRRLMAYFPGCEDVFEDWMLSTRWLEALKDR